MHSWRLSAADRVPSSCSSVAWCWPLEPSRYDRTSTLTAAEATELAYLVSRPRKGHWRTRALRTLQRLRQPVLDYLARLQPRWWEGCGMLSVLVLEMQRRQRSFWGWTSEDWVETLCLSAQAFKQRFRVSTGARPHLIAFSYLLCGFRDLARLGLYDRLAVARKVFGRECVDDAIQRVVQTVTAWGYSKRELYRIVCEALLANESPRLEDLSSDLIEELRRKARRQVSHQFHILARALYGFGILDQPPRKAYREHPNFDPIVDVAPEWVAWCGRWEATSTVALKTRRGYFHLLLQAGRWVTREHLKATSPERWTRETAAAYVAAVQRLTVGKWAAFPERSARERLGAPMSAKAKAHHLAAISVFFRDCQEWGWLPRRFDPRRSFAAPRFLRALLGPNPRVLADDVWAKLLWAGLNLTEDDLPRFLKSRTHYYPVPMVRALALIWLFAGLRRDEILRLRVGCMRWHRGDTVVPGTDELLPKDAVCLLEVPAHKTGSGFTKPVDRAVGEAIAAWERIRPAQPALVDSKTGEAVHFLLVYRGTRLGSGFLNRTLIPALCRKAGVPRQDARGDITSHRARSTIASQLASAREPMSLLELQQWLGHRTPLSTQYYIRLAPTRLAKAYADADYFARNLRRIEVLLDQEVVTTGAAARGEPWRLYDLGHGYCSYDFFDQCPHRMACARCAFYAPKGSSRAQALEGKANLLRMVQEIPLTEEEQAAVEDGVAAFDRLLEKLADVPTPAGPTPRQLGRSDGVERSAPLDEEPEAASELERPQEGTLNST